MWNFTLVQLKNYKRSECRGSFSVNGLLIPVISRYFLKYDKYFILVCSDFIESKKNSTSCSCSCTPKRGLLNIKT
jgi:hypothetical protein